MSRKIKYIILVIVTSIMAIVMMNNFDAVSIKVLGAGFLSAAAFLLVFGKECPLTIHYMPIKKMEVVEFSKFDEWVVMVDDGTLFRDVDFGTVLRANELSRRVVKNLYGRILFDELI